MATIAAQTLGNMLFAKSSAFGVALTQTAVIGLSLWFLLHLFGLKERWTQSATAVFGCAAILNVLGLPLLGFIDPNAENLSNALLLALLLDLWFYAVVAYILKHALEISTALSIVITMVILMALILSVMYLFGGRIG